MRGIGALLHDLGGGNQVEGKKYIGKKITGVKFKDDTITLSFGELGRLQIADEGQSCCEHRYMRTDDNIEDLIGDNLVSLEVKDGPTTSSDDEYGEVHETQFLEIRTTGNLVTFSSHNVHNGYYGGICLDLTELK